MLRFRGSSGSIEAMPQQEARVRALTDAELVRELSYDSKPDLFALAEAIERRIVTYTLRRGWHLVTLLTQRSPH